MQEFRFKCGGKELAKVLFYYGLIPDVSSSDYKIVCPFHKDINPSMTVDLEKGSYFCFGCAETGDAMSFVRKMNPTLSDLQACIKFFQILKSDKVERIDFSGRVKRHKKQDLELYQEAHDYYYGLSSVNWFRDKTDEVVETRRYMKKRGFSAKALMKCKAKVTYNKAYPIIFPMLDNGNFKGWVCRTNKKEVEQVRKYLYNKGFSRATTLVGDYGSKDYVFVVEGYMDRLKFIQFGEENVVAILGWKMSPEQIEKLRRAGVKYIISALDNDPCGIKGTEFLRTKFEVTRFCYLKGIKDPGEMDEELFSKMHSRTMKRYAQDRRKR